MKEKEEEELLVLFLCEEKVRACKRVNEWDEKDDGGGRRVSMKARKNESLKWQTFNIVLKCILSTFILHRHTLSQKKRQ